MQTCESVIDGFELGQGRKGLTCSSFVRSSGQTGITTVSAISLLCGAKSLMARESSMSSSYRDLRVWQKSMDLAEHVYRLTENFPRAEIYGLTSQLRRAAVSIPSNIAEGQGRTSKGEFRLFLGNARGSLLEVETQLMLANRMAYLNGGELSSILEECSTIGSMLNGLLASVSKASSSISR
jgi:four helix bundle protein